jgi:hypothetical protein
VEVAGGSGLNRKTAKRRPFVSARSLQDDLFVCFGTAKVGVSNFSLSFKTKGDTPVSFLQLLIRTENRVDYIPSGFTRWK